MSIIVGTMASGRQAGMAQEQVLRAYIFRHYHEAERAKWEWLGF